MHECPTCYVDCDCDGEDLWSDDEPAGGCAHVCEDLEVEEPGDIPDLGPCCACGEAGPQVRNIVMLHQRLPEAYWGQGWGCVQCGVPPDGASVVLCETCMRLDASAWQHACLGYPVEGRRVPIGELTEPFDHDYAYHPECWEWTEEVSETCGVCRQPLPDPDVEDDLDQYDPEIPLHLWRDGGREGLQMHWACAQRCIAAGTLQTSG
jgi:hypothetical protein